MVRHDGPDNRMGNEASADGVAPGSQLRIGIVHARWNSQLIGALLDGTTKALAKAGVKKDNIVIQSVPGSYELPYAVKQCVLLGAPPRPAALPC